MSVGTHGRLNDLFTAQIQDGETYWFDDFERTLWLVLSELFDNGAVNWSDCFALGRVAYSCLGRIQQMSMCESRRVSLDLVITCTACQL